MSRILPPVLVFTVLFAPPAGAQEGAPFPTRLYVAANGNDAWSGGLPAPNADASDGPFSTLERARDRIREMRQTAGALPKGGIAVLVRDGRYALDSTFALGAEDSGSPELPILYGAYPGETVFLTGGRDISNFQPVTDPAALERLDESAREHVRVAELGAAGVTDFGPPDKGGLEVFFNDRPMTLARWPNEGFVKIADLVVDDGHKIHGVPGSMVPQFKYDGDRPKRWVGEKDPWLHGYWFWDWSDQRQRIANIDVERGIITLAEPAHHYGYRKGQWYYAFNMLSELDAPGEWYVDREKGLLYFWPPEDLDGARVTVSVLSTLISAENVSHVSFRGFTVEASRGVAVRISGGEDNHVIGCVIRNTGGAGVSLAGARGGVADCEMYGNGEGGISLSGGDRATLTRGELYAENNHIHDYGRVTRMYTPGISMTGVGLRAANNLIHSAPHMGIIFGGNDNVIEFNEIHHVCLESNDAGAIYCGRDWLMRGNFIRHNYIHQVTGFEDRGCVGVYLDDMFSSAAIYGNVFHEVVRAAFIGGGRDCSIENNVFVDCNPAIHVDARALGWAHGHADEWLAEAQEKGTIKGLAWNKPPYSERYPELLTLIEDEPKAPKGNVIARNIQFGGKWDGIEDKARPYLDIHDNLLDTDPGFVDYASRDFRLKDDSPAYALGFQPIPVEQIGLNKRGRLTPHPSDAVYAETGALK